MAIRQDRFCVFTLTSHLILNRFLPLSRSFANNELLNVNMYSLRFLSLNQEDYRLAEKELFESQFYLLLICSFYIMWYVI